MRITNGSQSIGSSFEMYFSNLFASVSPSISQTLQVLILKSVTPTINSAITAVPTREEIRREVIQMEIYKSPSLDRMSVLFYKRYWNIVGEAVTKEVQEFFNLGIMKSTYNHTFLTLIPKTEKVERVDQYRPIALCNVYYKIITKLLVGRLKGILGDLIHPSQSAFIPYREIANNIIINQEVMHYPNGKKGVNHLMAIKIDLAKAYDRVEWEVLDTMLLNYGLDVKG